MAGAVHVRTATATDVTAAYCTPATCHSRL